MVLTARERRLIAFALVASLLLLSTLVVFSRRGVLVLEETGLILTTVGIVVAIALGVWQVDDARRGFTNTGRTLDAIQHREKEEREQKRAIKDMLQTLLGKLGPAKEK